MANTHPISWGTIKRLAETKGFDNIIPSATDTYALGASANTWKELRLGDSIVDTVRVSTARPKFYIALDNDDNTTGEYFAIYKNAPFEAGTLLFKIDENGKYATGMPWTIEKASSTDDALHTLVSGDAVPRLSIRADGRLEWGDGSASADTVLYRASPNTLKTEDTFDAASLRSNAIEIADSKGLNAFPTALKTIRFFDDFLGYNATNFRKAGTGGYADMVERAGVGRIITGSTSGNEYYILSNAFIDLSSPYEVEARLALGSTTSIHAGLYIYADNNNYIVSGVHTTYDTAYFENVIVDGGLSLNYGGTTSLDTLYHRFKIVEDTTNIKFYIDGSLDAVAGTEVHPSGMAKIGFYCKTLTAAARWIKFDWIRAEQDR